MQTPHDTTTEISIMVVDDQALNVEALINIVGNRFTHFSHVQHPNQFAKRLSDEVPNVVIMDLMLDPYMEPKGEGGSVTLDGLELMRQAALENMEAKFLVLTQFAHAQTAIACFKAGAKGFLPKINASSEQIVDAIYLINEGNVYIPTGYEAIDTNRMCAYTSEHLRALSQDEIDVISMLVSGFSYKDIAEKLEFKTEQSLRNKISRLLKKTPYTSMSRLSTFCATLGMRPISI